eukprot:365396-Chlamydomonas_euryale.AAC.25
MSCIDSKNENQKEVVPSAAGKISACSQNPVCAVREPAGLVSTTPRHHISMLWQQGQPKPGTSRHERGRHTVCVGGGAGDREQHTAGQCSHRVRALSSCSSWARGRPQSSRRMQRQRRWADTGMSPHTSVPVLARPNTNLCMQSGQRAVTDATRTQTCAGVVALRHAGPSTHVCMGGGAQGHAACTCVLPPGSLDAWVVLDRRLPAPRRRPARAPTLSPRTGVKAAATTAVAAAAAMAAANAAGASRIAALARPLRPLALLTRRATVRGGAQRAPGTRAVAAAVALKRYVAAAKKVSAPARRAAVLPLRLRRAALRCARRAVRDVTWVVGDAARRAGRVAASFRSSAV